MQQFTGKCNFLQCYLQMYHLHDSSIERSEIYLCIRCDELLSLELKGMLMNYHKPQFEIQHSRYLENWYLGAGLDLEASDF